MFANDSICLFRKSTMGIIAHQCIYTCTCNKEILNNNIQRLRVAHQESNMGRRRGGGNPLNECSTSVLIPTVGTLI